MRRARGFTLIELMMAVAILSILSSLAIPWCVRYVRRARAAEAPLAIRKMYDGAVSYFVADRADSSGKLMPRRFPGSAGPTPSSPPMGNKIAVPAGDWKTPQWSALDFTLSEPTRFSFRFDDNGQPGAAAFAQVIAQGDLDGDGVYSLYARSCSGTSDGVSSGTAVYSVNELE